MCCVSKAIHGCTISHSLPSAKTSIRQRISDAYFTAIQNFCQWLFKNKWIISSFLVASFFGEPCKSISSGVRRIFGWKSAMEKKGIFDAGDPNSLNKLRQVLHGADPTTLPTPVLILHGVFSSPDIWMPWSKALQQAVETKKIGHVITLQLPNDLKKRMEVVYQAIHTITQIYAEEAKVQNAQVDLMGHSLGGYAAHLATVQKEHIIIKQDNITRRWHSIDPQHLNQEVRKVISIAAPTWLCCQGQHDETTHSTPEDEDIYPWKLFSHKTIAESYTQDQITTIRAHHSNVYDIVGTQDAISATASPLPQNQVFLVKHGHLALASCQEVCTLAIGILSGDSIQ